MNPLRSFFTYITSGILSLRKNFHTLRIYKSEKFVDFALSDGPGGSVILEIKTNDINDVVKITASLESAGYCIFKKSVNFKDSVTFEGSIIADSTMEIESHLTCGGVTTLKSAVVERELKAGWLEIDGRVECGSIDAPNGWGEFKYLKIGDGLSNFQGQARFHHTITCDKDVMATLQITSHRGLNVFHDGNNVFEANDDGKVMCRDFEVYSDDAGDVLLSIDDDLCFKNEYGGFIGQNLRLTGLSTTDPLDTGVIWNDGGTLKISAG